MAEGDTIHNLARRLSPREGSALRALSPSGAASELASAFDARVAAHGEAHGKHLFWHFEEEALGDDEVANQSIVAGVGKVYLMPYCVDSGRIVTTDSDLERWRGLPDGVRKRRPVPQSAVYLRTGLPCPRCGHLVAAPELAGRRLYWGPGCQTEGRR